MSPARLRALRQNFVAARNIVLGGHQGRLCRCRVALGVSPYRDMPRASAFMNVIHGVSQCGAEAAWSTDS